MQKKHLMIGITCITILSILAFAISQYLTSSKAIDQEVFIRFDTLTTNVEPELQTIKRYDHENHYYYHFTYLYQLENLSGTSELILIYNKTTQDLTFYNLNDADLYPNEHLAFMKAKDQGNLRSFTVDQYLTLISE